MECAACGTDDELVYRCERCLGIFCATHHDHRYHDCSSGGSDLDVSDHDATDEPAFLWGEHLAPSTAGEWIWGSADDAKPAEGGEQATSSDEAGVTEEESLPREPAVEPPPEPGSATASGSVAEPAAEPETSTAGGSVAETAADPAVAGTAADPEMADASTPTAATATPASSSSAPRAFTGSVQDRPEIPQEASRPGYGPEPFSAEPVGPPSTFSEWIRRQTYLSLTVKVGIVASLFNLLAYSLIAVALVLPLG